jgi:hypothetical protein
MKSRTSNLGAQADKKIEKEVTTSYGGKCIVHRAKVHITIIVNTITSMCMERSM